MSFNIVATPIGNLDDISRRAIRVLGNSTIILCEKKTRALKLLNYYSIRPKLLIPYHDDKFLNISRTVIKEISNGGTVSLISDAGTPLISDPGHKLIAELIKVGIEPVSIPGPTSITSALVLSGTDISNFIFLGFLPKRNTKILEILKKNLCLGIPIVIFANSKDLKRIVQIIDKNFQDSFLSISKELSKIHEKTLRGYSRRILENINSSFYDKGEFVLVVKTSAEDTSNVEQKDLLELLEILKEEGISFKKSVNILNKKLRMSKKTIYSQALKKWDKD